MWQDTVIAICQLCFIFAMMPTILGKDKPALSTSVMNVVLVGIIAVTLGTLHLWLSLITATTTAITWLIIALQTAKLKGAKNGLARER